VFPTTVVAHTVPTVPDTVIVNVEAAPLIGSVNAGRLDHTYNVPAPAACVTTGVPNPPGSSAVALSITGEIVSHNVRFVSVVPPVFVTTIRYFTGWPVTGEGTTGSFCTVYNSVGAGKVNVPAVAIIAVAVSGAHAVAADTNVVFPTVVAAHTTPATPEIVNVYATPGPIVTGTFVHPNSVPDTACVTTGVGKGTGPHPVALVTTGEIVSATDRFVIVALPVFVTTIRYVIAVPGATTPVGTTVFTTDIPGTAASIQNCGVPETIEFVAEHADVAPI
jgi:hypothetical protein